MNNKIAIIGSIGVGKSTFLSKISKGISDRNIGKVKIFGEPSIIHGNLNDILLSKFYNDVDTWAYPLQAGISASHDAIFTEITQELSEDNKNFYLVDAPYSSFIYNRIHMKAGRMTEKEVQAIDNIIRDNFNFDVLIILEENADKTIERILGRSRGSEVNDLDYLHEHIRDYKEVLDPYIEKYYKNSKIIRINGIPDIDSKEYKELIDSCVSQIIEGSE